MEKTKVYDLPTRLFHWLFAGLFVTAFFIAKVIDDDSPTYAYHMLAGLVLAVVVGLRLIWGVVGSRYARFSSFALRPKALFQYFQSLLTGKGVRELGHNPASSWAGLTMMALVLGQALTGFLMASGGNKEALEDIHELLANIFVVVAIGHVAGVLLHTIRHRDAIGLSMVDGKKLPIKGQPGISNSHPGVALVFLAVVGAFVFQLGKNYDSATGKLQLFGQALTLGEAPGAEAGGEKRGEDGDDD